MEISNETMDENAKVIVGETGENGKTESLGAVASLNTADESDLDKTTAHPPPEASKETGAGETTTVETMEISVDSFASLNGSIPDSLTIVETTNITETRGDEISITTDTTTTIITQQEDETMEVDEIVCGGEPARHPGQENPNVPEEENIIVSEEANEEDVRAPERIDLEECVGVVDMDASPEVQDKEAEVGEEAAFAEEDPANDLGIVEEVQSAEEAAIAGEELFDEPKLVEEAGAVDEDEKMEEEEEVKSPAKKRGRKAAASKPATKKTTPTRISSRNRPAVASSPESAPIKDSGKPKRSTTRTSRITGNEPVDEEEETTPRSNGRKSLVEKKVEKDVAEKHKNDTPQKNPRKYPQGSPEKLADGSISHADQARTPEPESKVSRRSGRPSAHPLNSVTKSVGRKRKATEDLKVEAAEKDDVYGADNLDAIPSLHETFNVTLTANNTPKFTTANRAPNAAKYKKLEDVNSARRVATDAESTQEEAEDEKQTIASMTLSNKKLVKDVDGVKERPVLVASRKSKTTKSSTETPAAKSKAGTSTLAGKSKADTATPKSTPTIKKAASASRRSKLVTEHEDQIVESTMSAGEQFEADITNSVPGALPSGSRIYAYYRGVHYPAVISAVDIGFSNIDVTCINDGFKLKAPFSGIFKLKAVGVDTNVLVKDLDDEDVKYTATVVGVPEHTEEAWFACVFKVSVTIDGKTEEKDYPWNEIMLMKNATTQVESFEAEKNAMLETSVGHSRRSVGSRTPAAKKRTAAQSEGFFSGHKFILRHVGEDTENVIERYTELVEEHGGKVSISKIGKHDEKLLFVSDSFDQESNEMINHLIEGNQFVTYKFIDECIKQETLVDAAEFTLDGGETMTGNKIDLTEARKKDMFSGVVFNYISTNAKKACEPLVLKLGGKTHKKITEKVAYVVGETKDDKANPTGLDIPIVTKAFILQSILNNDIVDINLSSDFKL
uniref:BRCT domain-containing protein n=1 Tax=Rhabditophanes sp. KR3021 TaxID=114890 RepID=A0AC35TZC9_9BILA